MVKTSFTQVSSPKPESSTHEVETNQRDCSYQPHFSHALESRHDPVGKNAFGSYHLFLGLGDFSESVLSVCQGNTILLLCTISFPDRLLVQTKQSRVQQKPRGHPLIALDSQSAIRAIDTVLNNAVSKTDLHC